MRPAKYIYSSLYVYFKMEQEERDNPPLATTPNDEGQSPSIIPRATANKKMMRIDKAKDVGPIKVEGARYACISCIKGHRTNKCDHTDRPMVETKKPGRPASGENRKCDCPKDCKCGPGCKCVPKECICLKEDMWMIVLVDVPRGGDKRKRDGQKAERCGQKVQQVVTDLNGVILDADEIERRKQAKRRSRKNTITTDEVKSDSPASPKWTYSPATQASLDKSCVETPRQQDRQQQEARQGQQQPSKSCCHSKNVANHPVNTVEQVTRDAAEGASGCNCGHTCDCAFCPTHPDNAKSSTMLANKYLHMRQNQYVQQTVPQPFFANEGGEASCMGSAPRVLALPTTEYRKLVSGFEQSLMQDQVFMLSYNMGHMDRQLDAFAPTMTMWPPGRVQQYMGMQSQIASPGSEPYPPSTQAPFRYAHNQADPYSDPGMVQPTVDSAFGPIGPAEVRSFHASRGASKTIDPSIYGQLNFQMDHGFAQQPLQDLGYDTQHRGMVRDQSRAVNTTPNPVNEACTNSHAGFEASLPLSPASLNLGYTPALFQSSGLPVRDVAEMSTDSLTFMPDEFNQQPIFPIQNNFDFEFVDLGGTDSSMPFLQADTVSVTPVLSEFHKPGRALTSVHES